MKKLILLVLLSPLGFSCSNDKPSEIRDLSHLKSCMGDMGCDDCVIIDKDLYNETQTNKFDIDEVKIHGDCLQITFSAGGCSGETWEMELIDQGAIAESYPVQRYLRMRLIDKEECEAYITKMVSFNIAPLQVNGDELLYLNIEGWKDTVLYGY